MFSDIFENIFPSLFSGNQRPVYNGLERPRDDLFAVRLDVSQFRPIELTVKIDGPLLIVTGKHESVSKNGSENMDFRREFPLPAEVDRASITSRITAQGVLVVEGIITKDDGKNSINNDAVDISDACKFHVYINISGYKPEEISVKLSGNDLVVEGKSSAESKSDDGKRKLKRTKSFNYSFTLPQDIDINNLVPKFSAPSRLDIEAPRLQRPQECSEKNLEIKG